MKALLCVVVGLLAILWWLAGYTIFDASNLIYGELIWWIPLGYLAFTALDRFAIAVFGRSPSSLGPRWLAAMIPQSVGTPVVVVLLFFGAIWFLRDANTYTMLAGDAGVDRCVTALEVQLLGLGVNPPLMTRATEGVVAFLLLLGAVAIVVRAARRRFRASTPP